MEPISLKAKALVLQGEDFVRRRKGGRISAGSTLKEAEY